jgi:membrane metallo-endopeptidase-like protein 1
MIFINEIKAIEMIENIKNEFKLMVNENKWMDGQSKREALTKADFIDQHIGYPDYVYNNTYLDRELYNGYNFNEKSYFNNLFIFRLNSLKQMFSKLRKPIDNTEYINKL